MVLFPPHPQYSFLPKRRLRFPTSAIFFFFLSFLPSLLLSILPFQSLKQFPSFLPFFPLLPAFQIQTTPRSSSVCTIRYSAHLCHVCALSLSPSLPLPLPLSTGTPRPHYLPAQPGRTRDSAESLSLGFFSAHFDTIFFSTVEKKGPNLISAGIPVSLICCIVKHQGNLMAPKKGTRQITQAGTLWLTDNDES